MDKSCACQTCGKQFSTVNAYNNHLKSKKHRETAARDECLMPDVQQANTKNERKRKDASYLNDQVQCSSEATSSSGELGASGGVAEKHELQKDIGTTYCITVTVYLVNFVNKQLVIITIIIIIIIVPPTQSHRHENQS